MLFFSSMKKWLQISLLLLLTGCASPYQPVYTSSEGDYYIEEQAVSGYYYGTGSLMYANTGFYPWWVGMYHPHAFFYYSPYFYPYYFSVSYPYGYYPFSDYGYYRGFDARWHPPHRIRRDHLPGVAGDISISPSAVSSAHADMMRARPYLWRSAGHRDQNRATIESKGIGYSTDAPVSPSISNRRMPANPYAPSPRVSPGRPAGSVSSSPRSISAGRSVKSSSRIVVRDRQ